VIEQILPPGVVASEAFDDPPEAELYPEEAGLVCNAVEQRRREFTTARMCARRALAALGLPPAPVLPGPHGAPRWPDSVVGSITHCTGYRAAALARTSDIAMLGIDAEPDAPLPDGVLEVIALPGERTWVRELRGALPEVCWDRLLFSMKEAVYKSWYPFTGHRLGFEDADITVDTDTSTFSARIRLPYTLPQGPALDCLHGRWLAEEGLVLSAIAVPATPRLLGRRAEARMTQLP
jgi:4'-phosphopantetheinyl transferase EntD